MPGKPYDKEFEKRRWAIIHEQQTAYDRSRTDEQKAKDLHMLFNAWRWRFEELGKAAEPYEQSGWIEVRKRYAKRSPA